MMTFIRPRLSCGQPHAHQQGLVLIVVVMLVFLMTTLLAFLVEDQHLLLRRISNQSSAEQAFQLAEGASEWGIRVLQEDVRREVDYLGEKWAEYGRPIAPQGTDSSVNGFELFDDSLEEEEPLPSIDFGEFPVEFYISDLQAKYNLNNLAVREPQAQIVHRRIFTNLLSQIGIEAYDQQETLVDSLMDWMDSNLERKAYGVESDTYASREVPYFASDQPLTSMGELRYVNGFDAQIIADLISVATVLPETNVPLNLNTASAETVASLSQSPINDVSQVMQFLSERDQPGFQGFDSSSISAAENAIIAVASGNRQVPVRNMLAVNSRYFQISAKVTLGDSVYCLRTNVFRPPQTDGELQPSRLISREFDALCEQYQPTSVARDDSLPDA